MHKHKDLIDKYRYLIAGILIAILIFLTYSTDQFGIKESINGVVKNVNKQTQFDLQDRCGLMPGASSVSHTIASEEMCENECRARCVADDLSYDKAVFKAAEQACNTCKCDCK